MRLLGLRERRSQAVELGREHVERPTDDAQILAEGEQGRGRLARCLARPPAPKVCHDPFGVTRDAAEHGVQLATVSRQPSKGCRVRGRQSRQQPSARSELLGTRDRSHRGTRRVSSLSISRYREAISSSARP